jgi:branched-chain amino acid transport system permease protein
MLILDNTGIKEPKASEKAIEGILIFCLVLVGWGIFVVFLSIESPFISFGMVALVLLSIWMLIKLRPGVKNSVKASMSKQPWVPLTALAIGLLLFPIMKTRNPYLVHIMTMVFIYGIMIQGLNVQLGEMNAVNVGYAGFFAIGAYTSALLSVDAGWSFWPTIIVAIIACWMAGALVGLCVVRATGDYLALVTLGFGLIIYQLITNMKWLTYGTDGIHVPKPILFGHNFGNPISLGFLTLCKESNFYYLSLVCLFLSVILVRRVTVSWIGHTWAAERQDRLGVSCFGVNIPWMRVKSFAFGASFAGVAGALYAGEIGYISTEEFTLYLSLIALCMVILGGMGNWWGVIIGTFIMTILPEKLREFQELKVLLYGFVLLILLIYKPLGLFAGVKRKYEKVL